MQGGVASSEGMEALAWAVPADGLGKVCVFVDRDGVINERVVNGYVTDWKDFHWRPDAFAAFDVLAKARLPVVVASNQRCVALGLITAGGLTSIMQRMGEELRKRGTPITAWYCCPHDDAYGCDCRKPKPGMLRRAAREFGFDLHTSWFIGDTNTDEHAARAAGCTPVIIDPSKARSFVDAANTIVAAQ
jgi:D-glycero-D-manno-heptose 1,7-bisphosphate phosphatase